MTSFVGDGDKKATGWWLSASRQVASRPWNVVAADFGGMRLRLLPPYAHTPVSNPHLATHAMYRDSDSLLT
jgi:hypothetical protein